MVTALYRRYRPETFGEMIGQSQVTEPLMTALRTNRVNHAYLFSGPRGCGKTTSARILARCLNCAEGPTDTPCGVCPSCVELSRDGSGSLDVVEIDAASHNGVDDARDLRERAVFAPARDRYKIFILDEAHMVTPQGFNALLKIVEEPPEHIKFIFATTEPDKVIGTIRSRTHHYPFRLIPPAQLLEYVQALCEIEGVAVAPGVLPLVVRAGGGSARDTLSLLDQLIAGSESNRIEYERAVALLGYTHASLLGEVIDALGNHDSAAAFGAVDRVIQTGQDPRRFVEDLLERLRDVIIVAASRSPEGAAAVLRGMPSDDILQMQQQAALFGAAELSRTADIVNAALTEMTGATSPRLHLELMIARVLVPASDDSARGALARVERLERRVGVGGAEPVNVVSVGALPAASVPAVAAPAAVDVTTASAPAASLPAVSVPALSVPAAPVPVTSAPADAVSSRTDLSPAGSNPATLTTPTAGRSADAPMASASATAGADSGRGVAPNSDSSRTPATGAAMPPTAQQLKDAWPEILESVQKLSRSAWMVVYTATVRALEGDILTLSFPSENDVASFKQRQTPGQGVSEVLRQAIVDIIGLRVKFIARVDAAGASPASPSTPASVVQPPATQPATAFTAPQQPAPAFTAPQQPAPRAAEPTAPRAAEPTAPRAVEPTAQRAAERNAPDRRPVAAATPAARGTATAPAPAARRTAAPGTTTTAAQQSPTTPKASGAPTTSWPTVAIPTSAPEPGDEPIRAGAIAVDIPAHEIPDDVPESPIADYADDAGWFVPGDDIPLGDGPTDVDPSDFRPSGLTGGSAASGAGDRSSGGPVWIDASRPIDDVVPSQPQTAATTSAPQASTQQPSTQQPAAQQPTAQPPARAERPQPTRPMPQFGEKQRYGEAVVREILGASFIEERPVAPRTPPGAGTGPGREG